MDFYNDLKNEEWMKKKYIISDGTGKGLHPSGNLLLSKYVLSSSNLCVHYFDPKTFLLGQLNINGRIVNIGVIHLKAGNFKEYGQIREEEIKDTLSILLNDDIHDAFLIGDFNFRDEDKESNKSLENQFVDSWQKVQGTKNEGFTYDLIKNQMALAISNIINIVKGTDQTFSGRYDRILCSSKGNYWRVKDSFILPLNQYIYQKKVNPSTALITLD